jgi:putative oxidoreductase
MAETQGAIETATHAFARLQLRLRDYGLLFLRVGAGVLIWFFHVIPKLQHFQDELHNFPDPLGVGHATSFGLSLLGEGVCATLVMFGALTRLSCLPIIFTMLMVLWLAIQGFEGADVQAALLYALPYVTLAFTGPGRISFDTRLSAFYERTLAKLSHHQVQKAQT